MPWLADLVQSSESSLNSLPLQCLCEFLLMKHNTASTVQKYVTHKQKSIKSKVAGRLQDLLFGSEATQESASSLVLYFINRWSSTSFKERESSVLAFKTIVLHQKKQKVHSVSSDSEVDLEKASGEEPFDWLHERLMSFPFTRDVLPQILAAMIKVFSFYPSFCSIFLLRSFNALLTLEEWVFVESALKLQCYICKNYTLPHWFFRWVS